MEAKTILLSVLGASTVGGVAVGGYYFIQPKYIKDLLLKEKLTLLDTSENSTKDDEQWEKLIKHHTAGKDPVELKNNVKINKLIISDAQTTIDKNKLKKQCQELFNKKIGDKPEEDKENAKNWCTKESRLLVEENTASS